MTERLTDTDVPNTVLRRRPAGGLPNGHTQGAQGDGGHQPRVLGDLEELGRDVDPAVGGAPPQQRLGADDGAGPQVDHGLEPHLQAAVVEGVAQACLHPRRCPARGGCRWSATTTRPRPMRLASYMAWSASAIHDSASVHCESPPWSTETPMLAAVRSGVGAGPAVEPRASATPLAHPAGGEKGVVALELATEHGELVAAEAGGHVAERARPDAEHRPPTPARRRRRSGRRRR